MTGTPGMLELLDGGDADGLAALLADHPELATTHLESPPGHPRGASPLSYVAMLRFDAPAGRWRDVEGTGRLAHLLLEAGAPVDGSPDDSETPLITAASYGDADVARVLVEHGANVDALATPDGGGVPNGSALLHAAVFGMTSVVDVLVAAGATVRSIEEAAAAGDVGGWLTDDSDPQAKLRALLMAVDHERLDVIEQLVAAGTPVDEADAVFHRHPLRLAAANGRPASVRALLALGADANGRDHDGATALDLCRRGREEAANPAGHDAAAAILAGR